MARKTRIVSKTFFKVNNAFQPRNNPFNSSFNSLADKQVICLKMYEMAISESLIFKTFCSGMPPDPTRSSLVQTHIASIWGSQTWGLFLYKDFGCMLSDLQKVFTCHYRPNYD